MNDLPIIPVAKPDFKSGFVGIIGRPNVGKSTLMNKIIGQKIAITSPVAQTTRNRLRGIFTNDDCQIIFVDTPGIHKPHHQLGKVLVENAKIAINSVDLLLFLVDGSVESGGGDRYIYDLLLHTQIPVILCLNKIDTQSVNDAEYINNSYVEMCGEKGWQIIKFSALTGEGLDDLMSILNDKLPEGPYYYPPDYVTDQPERFIMGELIREQLLLLTREEIPHSVAVTIDIVEEDEKITRVLATIHVERDSQKGIVIGKKGQMLKEVGSFARLQMQKLIDGKVYLELFVKVQPKWRQSRLHLSEFGYKIDN